MLGTEKKPLKEGWQMRAQHWMISTNRLHPARKISKRQPSMRPQQKTPFTKPNASPPNSAVKAPRCRMLRPNPACRPAIIRRIFSTARGWGFQAALLRSPARQAAQELPRPGAPVIVRSLSAHSVACARSARHRVARDACVTRASARRMPLGDPPHESSGGTATLSDYTDETTSHSANPQKKQWVNGWLSGQAHRPT